MATILNCWGMVLCTDGGAAYARGFSAAKTLAPAPNYGDGCFYIYLGICSLALGMRVRANTETRQQELPRCPGAQFKTMLW